MKGMALPVQGASMQYENSTQAGCTGCVWSMNTFKTW